MVQKIFSRMLERANQENRRLVAPLMGFPGLNLVGCSVKLAQQNFGQHYKVIKALVDTYQPDIMFPLMDLSVEANALGRYTVFPKEESATVVKDACGIDEITAQENINIAFDTRLLGYVETVKLMSIGLPESVLIGAYVAGPYSLAALIMGADEAALATATRPDELDRVCEFVTERIQKYVRLLIAAGAKVICILEPTAVMLGPDAFQQFSAQYVQHINNSCQYTDVATIYHTCGNTMHLIDKMVDSGVDAVSLDAPGAGVDLPATAEMLPSNVVVMGNISPTGAMLTGRPAAVEAEVLALLKSMDRYPNFVLSTGCDLPQETPLENIHAFMRVGRRYRRLDP